MARVLSWGGRINQDLRYVASSQTDSNRSILRSRLFYRNVTQLNPIVRFSGSIEADAHAPVRSGLPYEQRVEPGRIFVNSALLHIRARDNIEIAFGRDALPTGLNLPDRGLFISFTEPLRLLRHATDASQGFLVGRSLPRKSIRICAWRRRGVSREGIRGGLLAEFDPVGSGRVVVGTNLLRANSRNTERSMTSVYARLGFGRWGLLRNTT